MHPDPSSTLLPLHRRRQSRHRPTSSSPATTITDHPFPLPFLPSSSWSGQPPPPFIAALCHECCSGSATGHHCGRLDLNSSSETTYVLFFITLSHFPPSQPIPVLADRHPIVLATPTPIVTSDQPHQHLPNLPLFFSFFQLLPLLRLAIVEHLRFAQIASIDAATAVSSAFATASHRPDRTALVRPPRALVAHPSPALTENSLGQTMAMPTAATALADGTRGGSQLWHSWL